MTIKYLSLGGIILDDIVFPDGRTVMSALGGGGLYAAAGMRLWSPQVDLWGRVGSDFDFDLLTPLDLVGQSIRTNERVTPRAWQLYEEDGARTQIPRIAADDWQAQLMPTLADLPAMTGVHGAHMIIRGHQTEPEVVARLAEQGLTVSLEPIVDADTTPQERETLFACLRLAHIFSPGLTDAYGLVGERPNTELLTVFAEMGPRLILLRQGAIGSLVYDHHSSCTWQVPAAEANVVDVTGGGNAYCGGFLVGWVEHGQVKQAAAQAAVSAAITIEQIGPPEITPARLIEAEQRLARCLLEIIVNCE